MVLSTTQDTAKYRILLRLYFLEEENPNLKNVTICKWDEEAEIN